MDSRYYILVTEWKYPTETGREIIGDFDSRDEALVRAFELAEDELDNFEQNTGDTPSMEEHAPCNGDAGAVVIATGNGLDEWFFTARVVDVVAWSDHAYCGMEGGKHG